MKRLILTFCSIISIIWLMPCFVHASYTAPDGNEYEYKITSITYGSNWYYTVYSNQKICFCEQRMDGSDFYPIGYYDYNDSETCGMIQATDWSTRQGAINIFYPSSYGVQNGSDYYCFFRDTDSSSNGAFACSTSLNPDVPVFHTYEQCLEYLTTPDVDYDDLIFDPSIPVPKYTSIYGILPLWNLGGTVTPQFPIQTIFSSMPDYNIEVQVRYYSPSKITFNGSRRSAFSEDWTINYNYDSLMPSEWYPLVTMQDNIQNNNLALQDSDYFYSWNNFITGYDSEQIEFVLDPVFISPSANTSIKAYAETEYSKMRNIGGCYGNQFEIMARNYYVNNGNVFVGNWFHWNSLTPEYGTAEYSNDARQDNVVNGVQNTVNTNDLPTGNSLTTVGEPTGNAYNPSNNIVINNNVPNYPDYPTVADYNRDNILVGFIKTAKSMPQYLGEFNDFLKMAFSFIDPSVWAVISLGFGASIVIMIIKVL